MVLSAVGLPILLQASTVQLQDLVGGLTPGTTVKGRVVEILPGNQALVSLRGQNVVAQLPANADLAKGDVLNLQVVNADAGDASTPASLALKLISVQNASGSAAPAGSSSASATSLATGSTVGQLEQALAAAKLPSNSVNLTLAQTLSRLGAPLDPQTLRELSLAVESLVANEQASGAGAAAGPGSAVLQAMQDGLSQMKVAGALSPSSERSVFLGQAARSLEAALEAGASPSQEFASNGAALVQEAVAKVLADPDAETTQALGSVLGQLGVENASAAGAGEAGALPASSSGQASPGAVTPTWQPSLNSANSAELPAMREALAQWLGPMSQQSGGLTAGSLAESAQALAEGFGDASQASTQRLIAAVQVQSPESTAGDIQNAGAWAMRQAAGYFAGLPAEQALPGAQAVQSGLLSQGLPVPKADLATLPSSTVAEAVAWLNARGLPPQRPLVETVAAWLSQEQGALPSAQKALQAGGGLSADLLQANPALKQAYEALGQALDAAGLDMETDGLSGRLQSLASAQGLNLESSLATTPATEGAVAVQSPLHGGTLREALMRVENELNNALQEPGQGALGGGPEALNSALKDAQAAVRSFNALPLQAQSAPAFDTVHLPMPVWMNGVMGDGQLSVTWRQGRARELDDKDPVNVAVSLNTESLGAVKVHLQVWKSSAGVRVTAQDGATAAFLEQGADDLREGFAENTPFALRSLDFSAESAAAAPPFSGFEPPRGGLSVSA